MKKNYIAPTTDVTKLKLERSLLAGSFGDGAKPKSETLSELPETGNIREGNLAREVYYPQNYNVWDE
ncbi:MAG: hypothetical protein IJS97_07160 [Prevotella sp.]|nr:hypothetical protein [Prevotella sp.]